MFFETNIVHFVEQFMNVPLVVWKLDRESPLRKIQTVYGILFTETVEPIVDVLNLSAVAEGADPPLMTRMLAFACIQPDDTERRAESHMVEVVRRLGENPPSFAQLEQSGAPQESQLHSPSSSLITVRLFRSGRSLTQQGNHDGRSLAKSRRTLNLLVFCQPTHPLPRQPLDLSISRVGMWFGSAPENSLPYFILGRAYVHLLFGNSLPYFIQLLFLYIRSTKLSSLFHSCPGRGIETLFPISFRSTKLSSLLPL